jgi:hypothetical protein
MQTAVTVRTHARMRTVQGPDSSVIVTSVKDAAAASGNIQPGHALLQVNERERSVGTGGMRVTKFRCTAAGQWLLAHSDLYHIASMASHST